jgi:hypothetical protein
MFRRIWIKRKKPLKSGKMEMVLGRFLERAGKTKHPATRMAAGCFDGGDEEI